MAYDIVPSITTIIETFRPNLRQFESKYKDIHAHPELSCREENTAAVATKHLETLSFETWRNVVGHGVVGVLKNGPGSTVLLRAELDALPILEQTGLPYASKHHMLDSWGVQRPVMHACGHDMHMACLMAAATTLESAKFSWRGILIALFQPNEEYTCGAQAMIDDGLYNKVPIPDVILGQHSIPMRAGRVTIGERPVLVAADTITIRIFGGLGDTANPSHIANPIVLGSKMILRIQSIRDQEISQDEFAVITCSAFHAGNLGNDVLESAELKLDVKTYDPDLRETIYSAIKLIVNTEARAAGVAKMPDIERSIRAPLTSNSPDVAAKLWDGFRAHFNDMAGVQERRHACENFSILATSRGRPYAFWFFGRVDPYEWDKAEKHGNLEQIANDHSPFNALAIHPTLGTGSDALAVAALKYFELIAGGLRL